MKLAITFIKIQKDFENGLKALENGDTSLAEILRITED